MKTKEEATWECVAGQTGAYHGIPLVYQGCGIIEPAEHSTPFRTLYTQRACACEREALEQYRQKVWRSERRAALRSGTFAWLGDQWSDLPLIKKTFENFCRERQVEAYDTTLAFKDILAGTLILHGSYGTGKTHLLAALCNELHKKNTECRFVSAAKLFHFIQEKIAHHESYAQVIRSAASTPLLVLDDVDKAKYSEFREEIYFDIIDARVMRELPIAISTNRFAELPSFVGGACASRLRVGLISIEMVGEDYRGEI